MIYLLDTNTCIYYLNGKSTHLRQQLEAQSDTTIRLCSIVKAELLVGVLRHVDPLGRIRKIQPFLNRFDSLPFDDNAAEMYSLLRTQLEKSGQVIGPNDMLIAAIALAHNLTVVTHNTREFQRIARLRLEDWF